MCDKLTNWAGSQCVAWISFLSLVNKHKREIDLLNE